MLTGELSPEPDWRYRVTSWVSSQPEHLSETARNPQPQDGVGKHEAGVQMGAKKDPETSQGSLLVTEERRAGEEPVATLPSWLPEAVR